MQPPTEIRQRRHLNRREEYIGRGGGGRKERWLRAGYDANDGPWPNQQGLQTAHDITLRSNRCTRVPAPRTPAAAARNHANILPTHTPGPETPQLPPPPPPPHTSPAQPPTPLPGQLPLLPPFMRPPFPPPPIHTHLPRRLPLLPRVSVVHKRVLNSLQRHPVGGEADRQLQPQKKRLQ